MGFQKEILGEGVELYLGDCLEVLPSLPEKFTEAIITDLPYGTTACSWDVIIPFEPMWKQVERINKGVFVTTAGQPFTSKLVMSNIDNFWQDLVWDKVRTTNVLNANKKHLIEHENILVFYGKNGKYNPIKSKSGSRPFGKVIRNPSITAGNITKVEYGVGYPKSIITHMRPNNLTDGYFHPTQKPESLYRYFVITYTNENDTVLDFTMGSGTTGVACVQLGRKFIGIEIEEKYYNIAKKRISDAMKQMRLL